MCKLGRFPLKRDCPGRKTLGYEQEVLGKILYILNIRYQCVKYVRLWVFYDPHTPYKDRFADFVLIRKYVDQTYFI